MDDPKIYLNGIFHSESLLVEWVCSNHNADADNLEGLWNIRNSYAPVSGLELDKVWKAFASHWKEVHPMSRDLDLMEEDMSQPPKQLDLSNLGNIQGEAVYKRTAQDKYYDDQHHIDKALEMAVELCKHRTTTSTEHVTQVADELLAWRRAQQ